MRSDPERDIAGFAASGRPICRRLVIADVGVLLEATDPRWWELLWPVFAAFEGEAPTRLSLRLETTPRLQGESVSHGPPGLCEVVVSEGRARLRSWYEAEVDLRGGSGWIRGPVHRAPIDMTLRQALPYLIPDSLSFHAALLAVEGRGRLLVGPSGCGKSTLTGLFPEARWAEEHCLVSLRDGRWVAHALPFRSSRPGWLPLEGIHLLRHGAHNELRELSESEGLRRVAREVLWPESDRALLRRSWELLMGALAEMPPTELAFRPDPGVWQLLVERAAPRARRLLVD